MSAGPRFCVVIPAFNHGLTVADVADGARKHFPVTVVDDGSTDNTAAALTALNEIIILTLNPNQGKASALACAFTNARERGFTHAITIDADGQHPVAALPDFAAVARTHPDAFIIGVRDLKSAGAPLTRRISNALSTFWFHFETGLRLPDTQCGFRVYPLNQLSGLHVRARRYAYELEIMVKAAWAGIPLVPCPVQTDYAAPTSRLSHFHPCYDLARACGVHSRLAAEAVLRRGCTRAHSMFTHVRKHQ